MCEESQVLPEEGQKHLPTSNAEHGTLRDGEWAPQTSSIQHNLEDPGIFLLEFWVNMFGSKFISSYKELSIDFLYGDTLQNFEKSQNPENKHES